MVIERGIGHRASATRTVRVCKSRHRCALVSSRARWARCKTPRATCVIAHSYFSALPAANRCSDLMTLDFVPRAVRRRLSACVSASQQRGSARSRAAAHSIESLVIESGAVSPERARRWLEIFAYQSGPLFCGINGTQIHPRRMHPRGDAGGTAVRRAPRIALGLQRATRLTRWVQASLPPQMPVVTHRAQSSLARCAEHCRVSSTRAPR